MTLIVALLAAAAALLRPAAAAGCTAAPPRSPRGALASDAAVIAAVADARRALEEAAATLPLKSGLVASIVQDQTTLWSGGFGGGRGGGRGASAFAADAAAASAGASAPPPAPGAHSLVRVASITKVFTDALLYALRDDGVVALDDALAARMPGFALGGRAPGARTRYARTRARAPSRPVPSPAATYQSIYTFCVVRLRQQLIPRPQGASHAPHPLESHSWTAA